MRREDATTAVRRNRTRIIASVTTSRRPVEGGLTANIQRPLVVLILSVMLVASCLAAVAGSLLDAPSASAASGGVTWGTPTPLPGNPSAAENWMSCTSPGNCTVVGTNGTAPFAVTETAGAWGTPTLISGLPSGADFQGVSCTSPGNCTGVGGTKGDGTGSPIVVVETAGIWGGATTLAGSGIFLNVSCPGFASGLCTAVGTSGGYAAYGYETSVGNWLLQKLDNSNIKINAQGLLYAISCPSIGTCLMAGEGKSPGQSNYVPMVINYHPSGPGTVSITLQVPSQNAGLITSIACTDVNTCDALGVYSTNNTNTPSSYVPYSFPESGGVWTASAVPGNSSTELTAMSCRSAGNCTAVGGTAVSAIGGLPVYDNETSGVWGTATTLQYPGGNGGYFNGLGCSSGVCTAVGTDNNGHLLVDTTASISGVTFTGSPTSFTVTVNGSGFGTQTGLGSPPSLGAAMTPCGPNPPGNGNDFGGLFYFNDTTHSWSAGQGGMSGSACSGSYTGLVPSSYSPTRIVFTVGSTYPTYGSLQVGDGYSIHLLGTSFTGTVVYHVPPAITSTASTTFTESPSQSFTVTTTGYPTPALSESGTLPNGVTFADNGNGTATLSGYPFQPGSFPFTINANNGVGSPASQPFTLTVNPVTLDAATTSTGTGDCTSVANSCDLATALYIALPGDVIQLVTPGASGVYSGGFGKNGTGTSALYPITIQPAPGVANPTLDGGGSQAVFTVYGTTFLDINGVTIQNGNGPNGGGISNDSSSTVSVDASTFANNAATFSGGAIDNGNNSSSGTLHVTNSTFTKNSAGYDGGAIDNGNNNGTGTLTVADSTFSGNTATNADGGAIDNADNNGTGTLSVTSSTFAFNAAPTGASIADGGTGGLGNVTIAADVFAGVTVQCSYSGGTWTDSGYNAAGDTSCFNGGTADVGSPGVTAKVGPLANHGGPTQTIALLFASPASGLIPNGTGTLCPAAADQRGIPSVIPSLGVGACDAGAVQLSGQLIQFATPAPGTVGTTATMVATASVSTNAYWSFNPVVFKVAKTSGAGVCTVSGTHHATVHFLMAGMCKITATLAGNANFTAARPVTKTITVT